MVGYVDGYQCSFALEDLFILHGDFHLFFIFTVQQFDGLVKNLGAGAGAAGGGYRSGGESCSVVVDGDLDSLVFCFYAYA